MQSKKRSLSESITNVVAGYAVAVIAQILLFPVFNIRVGIAENLQIGLFFTAISIARSYAIRRIYNARDAKR